MKVKYIGALDFIDRTIICHTNTSKKQPVEPKPKPEPEFMHGSWWTGYPFTQFWGNCHALLGDVANGEGYQQLCHHYYLQTSLGAQEAVARIKKFLGG